MKPSDGVVMNIRRQDTTFFSTGCMGRKAYMFPQFFVKMFENASIPSIIPWPPRKKSPVKDDRSEKMCYH